MIFVHSIQLAGRISRYLYAYAPSNILIRYLRSAANQRWALLVATALTAGYLAAAAGLNALIDSGGPGWLNLVALACAWNFIKFAWMVLASTAGGAWQALRSECRVRPGGRVVHRASMTEVAAGANRYRTGAQRRMSGAPHPPGAHRGGVAAGIVGPRTYDVMS
jgi:hypothetical protein